MWTLGTTKISSWSGIVDVVCGGAVPPQEVREAGWVAHAPGMITIHVNKNEKDS